jgi:hypothetical protein
MHTRKTRLGAGQVNDCTPDSTEKATVRQRVQLSAQCACTFVATFDPTRLDVQWHGNGNPARMGGLALARYRRARDSFIEKLALESRATWAIAETGTGYVRLVGLASCEPKGAA